MSSLLDANLSPGSDRESSGERHEVHESELGPLLVNYIDTAVVPTEDCNITDDVEENQFVVVDSNKPGLALLVGFEYFSNGEQTRPGVKKDLENMYELFHNQLGFEVQVKKDLTDAEVMEWMREVTSNTELLQRISCIVMVISSHGSEDEVKKRGIVNPDFRRQDVKFYQHRFSTKDGSIQTSEIIDMFDDGRCRVLKGKPKVFFIQACRGRTSAETSVYDVVDGGVSIRIQSEGSLQPSSQPIQSSQNSPVTQNEEAHTRMDAKGVKGRNYREGNKVFTEMSGPARAPMEEEITLAPPPCLHNCMIVMASPPGKAAWSDEFQGGWLITCLYKVYMEHLQKGYKIRMIRSITRINHLMALSMHSVTNDPNLNSMKCVPVMTHMLEKDIVLMPKNAQ